jgi:hypothetical protein
LIKATVTKARVIGAESPQVLMMMAGVNTQGQLRRLTGTKMRASLEIQGITRSRTQEE